MKKNKMKGFIGPIADDMPSFIAIILALTMFFSALDFTLTNYNEKIQNFNKIKGTMDVIKEINSQGVLTSTIHASDLVNEVKKIAETYGISYCIAIGSDIACNPNTITKCESNWVAYTYLIAEEDATTNRIILKPVEVCGG